MVPLGVQQLATGPVHSNKHICTYVLPLRVHNSTISIPLLPILLF